MTVQSLWISDWHPKSSPNNQKRHWRTVQQNHHHDRDMAWASAKHAGWEFMPGKVRLTITLIYPRKYRVDADNLAARCKGIIDGLKSQAFTTRHSRGEIVYQRAGFCTDDSTEWLELIVRAEVQRGRKGVHMLLESLSESASDAAGAGASGAASEPTVHPPLQGGSGARTGAEP